MPKTKKPVQGPGRAGRTRAEKAASTRGLKQATLDLSAPAEAVCSSEVAVGASPESPLPSSAEAVIPVPEKGSGKSASRSFRKRDASQLAKEQREISVSEFFMKNRHLLGFDNPKKALLTTIKEAVDNSLDACEEAGILPNIVVEIRQESEDRFFIVIEDNGPGIMKKQIPRVFGKLLYGSKFHKLKQSRGQQGIGISAAGMYGQLTTGKPIEIYSKPFAGKPAHFCMLTIDAKRNEPKVVAEDERPWNEGWTGTRVGIHLEAHYAKGRHSIENYLAQTALANPHASLTYRPPDGQPATFARSVEQMPVEPKEIKPHPRGIELGMMLKMLQQTKARNVAAFLKAEFSRVSPMVAAQILDAAGIPHNQSPRRMVMEEAEKIYRAIKSESVRILNPPTNCLSPIGGEQIESSLRSRLDAEFFTSISRTPAVYRGNPFLVEVGIAYGVKGMDQDGTVKVYRYANKVPLLYQPGSCAITQAVMETDWKNYALSQSRGALPQGPAVVLVHMASVWVPFTSESKEAVAPYPEIIKEIKLALQECGRTLGGHLRRKASAAHEARRRSIFEKYIGEIVEAATAISGRNLDDLRDNLVRIAQRKTKGGQDGRNPEEESRTAQAVQANGFGPDDSGENG